MKWVHRAAMLALAMTCVSLFGYTVQRGCEQPPPVQTKRCTHAPVAQDDGTALCRSYERRTCTERECGPWKAPRNAKR